VLQATQCTWAGTPRKPSHILCRPHGHAMCVHRACGVCAARADHTTHAQSRPQGRSCAREAARGARGRARTRELLGQQLQRGRRGHDRDHADEGRRRAARHQVVHHLRDGAACARRRSARPPAGRHSARSCALNMLKQSVGRSHSRTHVDDKHFYSPPVGPLSSLHCNDGRGVISNVLCDRPARLPGRAHRWPAWGR
jgi:hypothetical protein